MPSGAAPSRFLIYLLMAAPALIAQGGPQVLTFFSDVDDSDQPYALYLPRNFDASRKWPLVVSLHGADSNHRLNLRRVLGRGNRPGESDAEATRIFPRLPDVNYIIASPLARGTMGYQGIAEKDVFDMLADVKRRYPIDEDRTYLTGLSMGGGGGTLWIGLTRPSLWAAIAPVCPAPPGGVEIFGDNATSLAVHLFHGALDPVVPVNVSRQWHKRFLSAGGPVEYVEYPGVRHNSWDNAYKDAAIFSWFDKYQRNRYPDHVRFQSDRYKYDSAYWVRLDRFTPGTPALIDARYAGRNRLEIRTEALDGFTLQIVGHPMASRGQPAQVTLDGRPLKIPKLVDSLSFQKTAAGWRISAAELSPGEKRQGAEGPLSEAVASRHLYVYGTNGGLGDEETARRREVAMRAAEWSTPRSRLNLTLRAMADKDISESDLAGANLVLFGTKETNSLIARLASRLPMQLNAGAADYGLVFIYHLDGRYILINSGLPWWTGADQVKRVPYRFMPVVYGTLLTFGDFILFKGSLENVILDGRFDRNWKLTADDAAKIKATGAVEIR